LTPVPQPEATALELLPLLYSFESDGWEPFLRRLSEKTRSDLVAFHRYDFTGESGDFEHGLHAATERFREEYCSYYCKINPYVRGNRSRLRTDRAILGSDLLPLRELAATEFYCDFLRPQKLHHSIGIVAVSDAAVNISLTALRNERKGPYSAGEQRLYTVLGPHVRQALALRTRLGELQMTLEGLAAALDRLPQGAMLLDRHDRPLVVNRRAEALLAEDDGLGLGRNGLVAARSQATAELRRLLASPERGDAECLRQTGGALRLPRPSCREPLSLLVHHLPLRRPLGGHAGLKLVFITDPEAAPRTAEDTLRALYALTPAEARLTALLLQGRSVQEAADQLKITTNTARTHLKRVLSKTGTHRQAELVRVCLQGVAGVISEPAEREDRPS